MTQHLKSATEPRRGSRLLLHVFLLALAYLVFGRLALLLTTSAEIATAIFPSAGIALAGLLIWGNRLWPGIFIGSLLLKMWTLPLHLSTWQMVAAASGVAAGATLQALIGASLIRRFVGYPQALIEEKTILLFLFLGGPLSCLINASISVPILGLLPETPVSNILAMWWVWWLGDAVGVVVATPILLTFFGTPANVWRPRRWSVTLPLLLTCALSITVYLQSKAWEAQRIQLRFYELALEQFNSVKNQFDAYLGALLSLERFYAASEEVSRSEFRTFVRNSIEKYPGILALEWLPVVSADNLTQLEASIQQEGFSDFRVTERGPDGRLVPVGKRPEYVPVVFVEPLQGNRKALGFDVASNEDRREALLSARDTARPIMTARIELVQDESRHSGALIFQPIYTPLVVPSDIDARRRRLHGFVLLVLRMNDVLDAVHDGVGKQNTLLTLSDITEPASPEILYTRAALEKPARGNGGYVWESSFVLAERTLKLQIVATEHFIYGHYHALTWAVFPAGLIFMGLFGTFLLSMTGRAQEIKQLVARRTSELSGILTHAFEAIITLDESGRIKTANPAAESLLGFSNEQLIGCRVDQIIPDWFEYFKVDLGVTKLRRETQAVHKDDYPIPIELAISVATVHDRKLCTVIIHDLTEQQKVNRLKDEFVSTVSHELRTPLTSIHGSLTLLTNGAAGKIPAKANDMLKIAASNSARLAELIDDILDYEKLEFGKSRFNFQILDLSTLLQSAVEQNTAYAKQLGTQLKLTLPVKPVSVKVDSNRFLQVMANLLSNAIKFSPVNSQVEINTEQLKGNWVRIRVRDYGSGIPETFQDQVFLKFTQADGSNTRAIRGTGLGLSIVKLIVEQLGGQVGFNTQPGSGTTFFVDLPMVSSATASNAYPPPT